MRTFIEFIPRFMVGCCFHVPHVSPAAACFVSTIKMLLIGCCNNHAINYMLFDKHAKIDGRLVM
jgi:hypothetical protein